MWLHGFTQTKNSAHRFRSILAGTYEVMTIDLPGHGENAAVSASLDETADLLAEALPDEPFFLAGYSMGARVALHFALRHPRRLTGLGLISATAGIIDDTERASRRARDEALAARIESIGADDFLSEWLAQPMFATLPADPVERSARSTNASGLANSLRLSGTGTQNNLSAALGSLDVATTLIAGENDEKFTKEALRLDDLIKNSTTVFVARAGHATHLEQPDACAEILFDL